MVQAFPESNLLLIFCEFCFHLLLSFPNNLTLPHYLHDSVLNAADKTVTYNIVFSVFASTLTSSLVSNSLCVSLYGIMFSPRNKYHHRVYSKAKLKSNDDKASPCFRSF
jgi:hypothetical protein